MADSQTNLRNTLELIRSSTIKSRSEGLTTLKHIFRSSNHNAKNDGLDSDDYHLVFEALFNCAETERSLYVKAGKRQLKESAANRLGFCASAFRVVVEACVRKIDLKIVRLLLEHIIDSLPHPDGGHCEPLVDEYAKALRLILDDQVHVEHLRADKWRETLEFCLNAIGLHTESVDPSSSTVSILQSSHATQSGSGSGGRSFGQPGARTHTSSGPAAEFAMCVRRLVQAPNAWLDSSSSDILDSMLLYLRSSQNVGRGHHDAFAAVNQVFARTRSNRTTMTMTYAEQFLPLIREMWSSKRSSIREELLTTLLLVEPHIESSTKHSKSPELHHELTRLSDTMMREYSKRQEKDLLHLDDVSLGRRPSSDPDDRNPHTLCMALTRARSESAWMTVHFIAKFTALHHSTANGVDENGGMDLDLPGPNKRQKGMKLFDDYVTQLSYPSATIRLAVLQIVPMLIESTSLTPGDLSDLIERLASQIGDSNSSIACWSMIALTSCIQQPAARSKQLEPRWLQLWQAASRSLPSKDTCRCASYLLDTLLSSNLVNFPAVSHAVETMLRSAELDGPASLSEASLRLWCTLLKLRQNANTTGMAQITEVSLRWLFARWNPRQLTNKAKLATDMAVLKPNDVVCFIYMCLGLAAPPPSPAIVSSLGPLSQVYVTISQERAAVQYLLLLESDDTENGLGSTAKPESALQSRYLHAVHSLLIDLLISECDNVLSSWVDLVAERAQSATPDVIRHCLLFHLVVSRLLALRELKVLPQSEAARKVNDEVAHRVADLLGRPDCPQDRIDAALAVMGDVLPNPGSLCSVQASTFSDLGLVPISLYLHDCLGEHRSTSSSFAANLDSDSMDIDEEFGSQGARISRPSAFADSVRDDVGASSDYTTLRACVTMYLAMITTSVELATTEDYGDRISPKFTRYVCSMVDNELYACRPLLSALAQSKLQFSSQDAISILEHLATTFLQEYDFERCEPAILLCLEVLGGFSAQWTQLDIDKEGIGDLIFNWAMRNILKPGITSPRVQFGFALVCYRLAQFQYPLARTTIFELFGLGDCRVKYWTSSLIAEVLSRWKLTEHDEAFETLRSDHLPNDLAWSEKIAMRLEVVSKLAIKWPTLRRKCVYSIYETAAAMDASSRTYATLCIRRIATSLSLADSPTFFRLYAPQLLYTWLDSGELETAPYQIFGYSTLEALIRDVEHEVTAQLMMRRKQTELDQLSASLGKPVTQLLQDSFPKSCAYAMSWDMLNPVKDTTKQNSETLMYTLIGSGPYLRLVVRHLHEIVAIIICAASDVEQATKAMNKKETYARQSRRYEDMIGMCASSLSLPAQQQPSFPVKYLLDLLERLCRRSSVDVPDLWSPSRLTFCLRRLFEQMKAAYGSLHACACIRKIRLVVALAGDVALSDYPLQMLVHGLRAYMMDQHCAADTIGIVQYLYLQGKSNLRQSISFVAGSAASILLSTRSILSTAQDSTTQDSQYSTTKKQAEGFHHWFDKYLDELATGLEEGSHQRRFRSLVQNAAQSSSQGSARTGTPEGKLLADLLLDGQSRPPMLDQVSRLTLIDILQQNFQKMPSSSDDIISSDDLAKAFASQLVTLVGRPGANPNFLAWAARAIGRAFTSSNGSHSVFKKRLVEGFDERRILEGLSDVTTSVQRSCMVSRVKVILIIHDALRSTDPDEVAAAEEALRMILERSVNNDETRHCVDMTLSPALQAALHVPDRGNARHVASPKSILEAAFPESEISTDVWTCELTVAMIASYPKDPLLGAATVFIKTVGRMAEQLFPYLLHLTLQAEYPGKRTVSAQISKVCHSWFAREDAAALDRNRVLLQGLLYLRKQPVLFEATYNDRDKWLDIDYIQAARAAARCGWYNTALQIAETHIPTSLESSRRSSGIVTEALPDDLLVTIYENLDDPDSFYGAPRQEGLQAVLDRLSFEQDGYRGLLFRGARIDSQIQRTGKMHPSDALGIVQSLLDLNLNGLAHTALSSPYMNETGTSLTDNALEAARKLQQWDVKVPGADVSASGVVFEALQAVSSATSSEHVRTALEDSYLKIISKVTALSSLASATKAFTGLACLEEMDEVLGCTTSTSLASVCSTLTQRHQEIRQARYERLHPILSSRQTLFGILSKNGELRRMLGALPVEVTTLEIQNLLGSCATARKYGNDRELLAAATYLHDLVPSCREIGLHIDSRANFEVARVLWQRGEQQDSIRTLQRLVAGGTFGDQDMAPDLSTVYGMIASHVAEARMETPKEIIDKYFKRAIDGLNDHLIGENAGQVLHEFASFCDRQLHYSESREEFVRVERLRKQRLEEHDALRVQARTAKDRAEKWRLNRNLDAMKRWVKLDEEEYRRLRSERETLIELSIENLLRSLRASDLHNDDVLRFLSLWFEFADLTLANDATKSFLADVPSFKFTPVMNQLSSRLQAEKSPFQHILSDLVFRVCADHPYHGMYHIFSGANPQGIRDDASKSRQQATLSLSQRFRKKPHSAMFWDSIREANTIYNTAAMARSKDDFETGVEYKLDDVPVTRDVIRKIPKLKIPPITLHIEARSDNDYSAVPTIHHFKPLMRIAGGLSKPKIIIAVGSDGRTYRQLLKGGSDDLRQDTIMEQVFEQVSSFLKRHPATRQRDLLIRTYKVVPLSAVSGVIEFVSNTIPLSDVLLPMHEKYHPKDLRSSGVRKLIEAANGESPEARIRTFKDAITRFQPAMRYWFLETFPDPNDWYEKRLSYTRSVAASSILGYVMGLGDRHLHNILVDRKTGEVVHIDLGIAFEAGKVLPIPEIIPFRLTRDMVDGMGYSKTEGVFRRCCEFMLDTLREEVESILTVVNVLRYDPLCTWTVSPLKARKMQDDIDEDDAERLDEIAEQASKKRDDDSGEAARALAIVERKLAKTLSTAAMINELIQQATDEANLALLFVGWSAWV